MKKDMKTVFWTQLKMRYASMSNVKRKKNLPDKATMYWDFDCKVGASAEDAKVVTYETLIKELDAVKATGVKECYVEVIAKAVNKPLKVEEVSEDI